MTEEYKQILFDYITGNITNTSSSTKEVIIQSIIETNDLYNYLIVPWIIKGLVGTTNNGIPVYVVYGQNGNGNGFIALLDENFRVKDVITQYSSGTTLATFYGLQVAEDNTFYGVDRQLNNGVYKSRFVMLNNFTIPDENGNYNLKLRTSYFFQDADFEATNMLFKDPNSSHYVFVGTAYGNADTTKAIELTVNVGEANTWTTYSKSSYFSSSNQCAYVEFNTSGNSYIEIVSPNNFTNNNAVVKHIKDFTASTFTTTTVNSTGGLAGSGGIVFTGKDKFYYVSFDADNWFLYQYNSGNTLLETFYRNHNIALGINGTDLYLFQTDYNTNELFYQRYNGSINWKYVGLLSNPYPDIFINQQFNLLNIYLYGNTAQQTALIKEDYNSSNYNSLPYIDDTAIYPEKARLYINDNFSFARNESNITCLGNTYTTTVEIPNAYLNGDNINPSQLVGKTNQILVNYTENLVKNIYEKVYLNFVNKINCYNEDNGEYFDTTTLVKNISGLGETYANSKITKVIEYSTTKHKFYPNTVQTPTFTKTGRLTGRYELLYSRPSIYPDADKLAFIDDLYNIYFWIDISSLPFGIIYDLTQYVRLADIPLGEQNVIWNDNVVQYNGNDVVYYTSI